MFCEVDVSIRFCIADRQPRVRYGMRILLEQQPGWKVISEAADADEVLKQMHANCADFLLLDWELPGQAAEELIARLRKSCPRLRVITLSGHHDARQAALKAGVDGFASKTEPPERLISLIQEIASIDSRVESS